MRSVKIPHTICTGCNDPLDVVGYQSVWDWLQNETVGFWFGKTKNWRLVSTTAVAVGNYLWLSMTSEGIIEKE